MSSVLGRTKEINNRKQQWRHTGRKQPSLILITRFLITFTDYNKSVRNEISVSFCIKCSDWQSPICAYISHPFTLSCPPECEGVRSFKLYEGKWGKKGCFFCKFPHHRWIEWLTLSHTDINTHTYFSDIFPRLSAFNIQVLSCVLF